MTEFAAHAEDHGPQPILVGIPEVRAEWAALEWAAAEAAARRLPLHLLCAVPWDQPVEPWRPAPDHGSETHLRQLARGAVAEAIAHVRARWPGLVVHGTAVDAAPGQTLIRHSVDAAITVVGTRHLSALGGIVLGSVSSEVAARGSGTVVVVNGRAAPAEDDTAVVVGVDAYALDDDTLAYAFEHAALHARRLEAILCLHPDRLLRTAAAPERARRWLTDAVAGWQDKYPDVRVATAVTRVHPVEGLVSAARGQDLLVIGPGTRHPRVGSLLGSVAQGVLHHASCAVAVVHPPAG